jgi:hypothetical protein
MIKINREAFETVAAKVEGGEDLTLEMVLDVFGSEVAMMFIYMLMDAQEAARAIQLAILNLRSEAKAVEPKGKRKKES